MKSVNKLIYFFSNKYYNNLKFNNKVVSATRIFFERTTKTSHSLQALGNVYRNSKWTDLNVFNIKESSLIQFKNTFNIIIVFLILLVFLIRFDFQWCTVFLYNVIEIMTFLKDLVSSWFLSIFYTLSIISLRLTHFFSKSILTDLTLGFQKKPNYLSPQPRSNTRYGLLTQSTSVKTNDSILLSSLYLQKVTKYLHLVNMTDVTSINTNKNNGFLNLNHTFQNKLIGLNYTLFFMNSTKFNVTGTDISSFSSKEKFFYECVEKKQLMKTNYYLLNSNVLKSLPFFFQNELKATIKSNLNLGKENKWLMKNTLLSYDIITKNLTTTHLKKLYGNAQFNSYSTNSNIWMSNRLNDSTSFNQLNSSLNTKNSSYLDSNLLNSSSLYYLDNIEESFFWILKRFKFLQTTNTYYQFNSINNTPTNSTQKLSKGHTFDLLKNITVVNTSFIDTYNSHWVALGSDKASSVSPNRLQLDYVPWQMLTEFDLNFSKYFFNNLTFQKNNILVYSNLE